MRRNIGVVAGLFFVLCAALGVLVTAQPSRIIPNPHNIEGYADPISVTAGSSIEFKIHAPNNPFSIDFSRYGAGGVLEPLLTVADLTGISQDYSEDAYKNGADWSTTYTLAVPIDWSSGLYSARLYDRAASFNLPFVVKAPPGRAASLALFASSNTWQAYNDWGGASFYRCAIPVCSGGTYSTLVSLDRPNPAAAGSMHLAAGERFIVGWLEETGHPYSMLSDSDLHDDPNALDDFSTVIISTHSEYWSGDMYDALQTFHDRGGNILYLSGNGIYWKVTLQAHQLEVQKGGGIHEHTGERGGLWRALSRPEAALLGVRYDGRAYPKCGPYIVQPGAAAHWIFAGTGLQVGDAFGETGLNTATCVSGAASGWEMDGVDATYRPPGLTLLAEGLVDGTAGADMTYYEIAAAPPYGGVFSAGSITFGGSLAIDANLTQIVENVLAHFAN
ncbi:MAG: hypothetical protein HYR55_01000 [Acidobacteria bacterium]|nr:hypothetical protein [Acidobacteriota bacterium]MBI3658361.1 hypothetical protein [Acidobacteriota bacterium]